MISNEKIAIKKPIPALIMRSSACPIRSSIKGIPSDNPSKMNPTTSMVFEIKCKTLNGRFVPITVPP